VAVSGGHPERAYRTPTKKKQHAVALKKSGAAAFVLYTYRHTSITRWAKHMDPFTDSNSRIHRLLNSQSELLRHCGKCPVLCGFEVRVRNGLKGNVSPYRFIVELVRLFGEEC